jgi:hypothetical protein
LIYQNLPVITGKFFPFTENLLLPVNEILYRTIITNYTHHAEGQFNPNPVKKKSLLILDALEHVDSGNIKFKIGRLPTFFKT